MLPYSLYKAKFNCSLIRTFKWDPFCSKSFKFASGQSWRSIKTSNVTSVGLESLSKSMSEFFSWPSTLISFSFLAPWVESMHGISFESPNQGPIWSFLKIFLFIQHLLTRDAFIFFQVCIVIGNSKLKTDILQNMYYRMF